MECKKAEIKHFTIANASGSRVVLSNLGAGIVAIVVPDASGELDNVVLTYAKPEDWYADGPCAGKIPGRFANRIAKGKFSLGGKEYQLAINNGPNHLHGGPGEQCYANRIWDAEEFDGGVRFKLHSPDGDAGYPGALDVQAVYTFSDDNVLRLEISAFTDAPTILNLTNHVYFNLRGQKKFGGDGIRSHLLKLYASNFLPDDSTLVPYGRVDPVVGTPMDFTEAKPLGRDLDADFETLKFGKGYDSCWCIDGYDGSLRPAAELTCEGRKVTMLTNQPGVQVYTANWMDGCPASPDGYVYKDYDGVAMECQAFPDAPNKPQFPFRPLLPGETYLNIIEWRFSAE